MFPFEVQTVPDHFAGFSIMRVFFTGGMVYVALPWWLWGLLFLFFGAFSVSVLVVRVWRWLATS